MDIICGALGAQLNLSVALATVFLSVESFSHLVNSSTMPANLPLETGCHRSTVIEGLSNFIEWYEQKTLPFCHV